MAPAPPAEPSPASAPDDPVAPVADLLALADWRQRTAALYAAVRSAADRDEAARRAAWERFWTERDRLFREHPQSPLAPDARARHGAVPRFAYDPAARVEARAYPPRAAEPLRIELAGDGAFTMVPVARLAFDLPGVPVAREGAGAGRASGEEGARGALELTLYRIEGYGNGLFLPFGDASNGRREHGSYGGGRYLVDTLKNADPGLAPDPRGGAAGTGDGVRVRLDFNYAYHPSCAYHPRWDCPLAPPANRLPVAVEAGEAYEVHDDEAGDEAGDEAAGEAGAD